MSAETEATSLTLGDQYTVTASCSSGILVGGGSRLIFAQTNDFTRALVIESYPASTTSWTAVAGIAAGSWGTGGGLTLQAYAICAP